MSPTMTDQMPRVILDELKALAVHQLGEEGAARELVERVLAEHPDLAADAVGAPSPAERLQAVDKLFGRVRWAVREQVAGASRPAASPLPGQPPAPSAHAAPAPDKAKSAPWAPSSPPPPPAPATPRSMAVPPAPTMPKLEPPRTFIPTVVPPLELDVPEPADHGPADDEPADGEPASSEPAPVASAGRPRPEVEAIPADPPAPVLRGLRPPDPRPEPPRFEPPPLPASPRPMMRPRPAPLAEPSTQDLPAPGALPRHEPPPLQFEIIDDLYGIEAKSRRRRRWLIALAGLAIAAGAAWIIVASDLPHRVQGWTQGWEWPGLPSWTSTADAPSTEPAALPPLESLQLATPDTGSDQPEAAAANGTRRILRLDRPPEPAAGPTADPAADTATAGDETVRVFIHYDADAASASDAAAALYARLTAASAYATVVLRDVPYAIGSHRIRYYFPEDRPAAAALAEQLGSPPANDWQLQDFSFYRPQPARGTLEVFVPTG